MRTTASEDGESSSSESDFMEPPYDMAGGRSHPVADGSNDSMEPLYDEPPPLSDGNSDTSDPLYDDTRAEPPPVTEDE